MKKVSLLGWRIQTRMERRVLVVGMYSCFVIGGGLNAMGSLGGKWLALPMIAFIVLGLLAWYSLHRLTGSYAIEENCGTNRKQHIDERQARVRDQAMARSYLLVSLVLLISTLWMSMAAETWWWKPATYSAWNAIFWAALLLTSTLPQALIAWREPDEPAEEFGANTPVRISV